VLAAVLAGAAMALVADSASAQTRAQAAQPAPQVARFSRGLAIADWFWSDNLTPSYFERAYSIEDIRLIARLGFRNLRLPVQPEVLFNEARPEELNALNLGYVDRVVNAALGAGLNVTIDIHGSLDTDPATGNKVFEQRLLDPRFLDVFARFWRALAAHYSAYDPERLFLEPLNEPYFDDPSVWKAMAEKLVAAIRQVAPRHTIVLDACNWAGYWCLLDMEPLDDPNTVYAVHYYEPFTFTHQGAEWVEELRPLSNLPYPSSPKAVGPALARLKGKQRAQRMVRVYGRERWNRKRIAADIESVARWARTNGRQVIFNEFGAYLCYSRRKPVIRWNRDVRELLEASNIAWTRWDYDDGFGLFRGECSGRPKGVDTAMLRALLGQQA
jgi:hypothetical protein